MTIALDMYSTSTLYDALKVLQDLEDTYGAVVRIVEFLVKEREEKPNEVLYEALIRANVDPTYGSAEIARSLLKEMTDKGIPTSLRVYHAILEVSQELFACSLSIDARLLTTRSKKVTAVHPDYVLRSEALRDMKNRWYTPTHDGIISIIIGHLRDGQYELALEKLEELNRGHLPKPAWLYHIFVYVFGELGFHDETFQILQHQLRVFGPNQPMAMWLFLLDVYSRDGYYTGLTYIWHRMVVPGLLKPPDGTALNVLNVASRHGDTELVTSVMKMFTDRGKRLDMHHYEALIDAHVLHQDLRKAFNVLCVIGRAGLTPDASSTRSIYRLLKSSEAATDEALGVLRELRALYDDVPIAAFNVVLEATVVAHGGFQRGMDLYRGVRQVCAAGPDLATFHVLLQHCIARKSLRFLLQEMQALDVRPDPLVYDHAIRVFAMQDDYERAFWFLQKMTRAGEEAAAAGAPPISDPSSDWWMSRPTALALIRRCIVDEDARVKPIIRTCRERGMAIDKDVQRIVRRARLEREKRLQQGQPPPQQPQQQQQQEKQVARTDRAAGGGGGGGGKPERVRNNNRPRAATTAVVRPSSSGDGVAGSMAG